MNITDLKNVVGEVSEGEVAKIKFFGHIDEGMVNNFNSEFEFLEKYIKPSRIDILINSEGGSVLHGMSTFAVIQNSSVKTRCINEGLAASMASVILVAGDEAFMKDYAVLMIHQPFVLDGKSPDTSTAVKVFSSQLETIYHKRFGIPKSKIKAIMDGKAGEDGTYFDAVSAVKAGIIPEGNVITTPKISTGDVHAMIKNTADLSSIQNYFDSVICAEDFDFKPTSNDTSIHIQETSSQEEQKSIQNTNNMPDTKLELPTVGFIEASIAIQLGIKEFDSDSITARLNELVNTESSYKDLQSAHSDLQTELEGKIQAVQNLTANLADAQAKIDAYQAKEQEAIKAEIKDFIEKAVEQGRIVNSDTEINKWIDRATVNFELVKDVITALPCREKITEAIATDPENVQAAIEESKTEIEKLQAKVASVVGVDFAFLSQG